MLTIILIPVSIVLVVFAMRGFAQKWNVEVETHNDATAATTTTTAARRPPAPSLQRHLQSLRLRRCRNW